MDRPRCVLYDEIAKSLEVRFGLSMLFLRVRSFLARAVREMKRTATSGVSRIGREAHERIVCV